jgi:hypothetical protein
MKIKLNYSKIYKTWESDDGCHAFCANILFKLGVKGNKSHTLHIRKTSASGFRVVNLTTPRPSMYWKWTLCGITTSEPNYFIRTGTECLISKLLGDKLDGKLYFKFTKD